MVQASWSDLQPNSSSDFDTTVIDGALDAVNTYNAAAAMLPPPNNRQIGVRLRIFAGCTDGVSDAPAWAIGLDGSPITITASYAGGPRNLYVWPILGRYVKLCSGVEAIADQACRQVRHEPFNPGGRGHILHELFR